ncbi:indole-3-acetic acid-induced protein ARG7-like [Syzygium oleosum]|uniref:indole-3-acetic acid-induced protein ARG7-like n=1 Tax=Syzygium oleosum TaxID=219896 RepID=UPI0011D23E66|nr:indole-3-acetic acid-induced protein ARG7-like [Syzygium oleosum]
MASPVEQPNCDIGNIVKLKKMTSVWRKCNRASGGGRNPPSDVPPGHLAVLVGISRRRIVIKAEHLNHPIFRQLLDQAYEEYSHQRDGPLALPCDESLFREVVGLIECGVNADPSSCHVQEWRDFAPLICGSMRRSAC